MTYRVIDLTCPGCGQAINTSQKTCNYCGRELVITSFSSIYSMSPNEIDNYVNSYNKTLLNDSNNPEIVFSLGVCYLKLKLFDKAHLAFSKALEINPDNSDAYFYAAISLLQGKKAFLSPLKDIKKAIEYLEAACQIEKRGIYYYFLAYIKYDFYERKSLNINPNYADELKYAIQNNVTKEDKRFLFELLGVTIPKDIF